MISLKGAEAGDELIGCKRHLLIPFSALFAFAGRQLLLLLLAAAAAAAASVVSQYLNCNP
jgi:hypothetical protein